MSTELKTYVRRTDTWIRGLFILLFAVIYSIAEIVLAAIVLFQFGSQLFTGRTNDKLRKFSHGLTAYFYQLLQFFTYRSDLKPFPFSEWPEGPESVQQEESEPAAKQSTVKSQPDSAESGTVESPPKAKKSRPKRKAPKPPEAEEPSEDK